MGGEPPASHGYGVNCIIWFMQLVLDVRLPMRAASRVLELMSESLGLGDKTPHWTTGRLWLQRAGLYELTRPLEIAWDWIWLIDHSVQIGQEKCLVILGIRASELPPAGTSLQLRDLSLVSLVLRKSWTQAEVGDALDAAVSRTGVPRSIVSDHGVDVAGGVSLFQEKYPKTDDIYDFKHKAACLMKHRLEKNPRWQEFQTQLNSTRSKIQQTEMGFLTPTAQKSKARFMNLQDQLNWGQHMLDLLKAPHPEVLKHVTLERLTEKLDWINDFRQDIQEWNEWQQIINRMLKFVNEQGLYRTAIRDLKPELPETYQFQTSQQLSTELLDFIKTESAKAKRNERLPGSTEILESCFGRFKTLERDQSKSGFTTLIASFGALLTNLTPESVQTAMQRNPVQSVIKWCKEHIPASFASLRKLAFTKSASKTA